MAVSRWPSACADNIHTFTNTRAQPMRPASHLRVRICRHPTAQEEAATGLIKSKVAMHGQASLGPGPSASKHETQSVESRRGYAACRGYEPGQVSEPWAHMAHRAAAADRRRIVISQTPHQRSAPRWWQSCDGAGKGEGQLQDCMGGGVQQGKPASF